MTRGQASTPSSQEMGPPAPGWVPLFLFHTQRKLGMLQALRVCLASEPQSQLSAFLSAVVCGGPSSTGGEWHC